MLLEKKERNAGKINGEESSQCAPPFFFVDEGGYNGIKRTALLDLNLELKNLVELELETYSEHPLVVVSRKLFFVPWRKRMCLESPRGGTCCVCVSCAL